MVESSSSAVRRPPVLFEIVPPVATSRTFGSACAETSRAQASNASHAPHATIWRRTRRGLAAGICPLYASARLPVRDLQPPAQVTCRFVGRLPIERHQCCRTAGNPRDLRPPLAEADAGHFDLVFASVDDLFEAMHVLLARGILS